MDWLTISLVSVVTPAREGENFDAIEHDDEALDDEEPDDEDDDERVLLDEVIGTDGVGVEALLIHEFNPLELVRH